MLANWLTISRIPLLGIALYLLAWPPITGRMIAVPLIVVVILLDTIDGIVARARGETSLLGSVLDIATDRAVEYALWVMFAWLDLISPVIPLVVLVRGSLVDAVRSVAPSRGKTPFGLMQTPLGRFLVGSPWMRTSYSIAKFSAFVLLALGHAFRSAGYVTWTPILAAARVISWIALVLCLVRGIPVLLEAPTLLQEPADPSAG